MFSLTCIITIESTAEIEAQWSVQSTCFRCRQMWPHTDLTSASCCVPCRHVIPTVCLLDHSSTATHWGDAFSAANPDVTEEPNSENRLASFDHLLFFKMSRTTNRSLLLYFLNMWHMPKAKKSSLNPHQHSSHRLHAMHLHWETRMHPGWIWSIQAQMCKCIQEEFETDWNQQMHSSQMLKRSPRDPFHKLFSYRHGTKWANDGR